MLQYNLYLLDCKYKNIDIINKIIKKYCKKEYHYYIIDKYINNDLSEIEDNFILKIEFLKDRYKKYKYIFIN